MSAPKILYLDIETAPIIAYVWGLWQNDVSLNQIKSDWHVLAWAAKWHGDPANKIMYKDQRNAKKIDDDKDLLKDMWNLIDEADIIVTQNGKAFDIKKLNARFIINGFTPPSPVKHIDTKEIASKKFGFSSKKLEYMTGKLCKKYKKLKHNKFPGFELWTECLAGNLSAWKEMEKYNKYDVLSLEELYSKLQPWDTSVNLNLYTEISDTVCMCGSSNFRKKGFMYTTVGKYQQYQCKGCGAWSKDRQNLFTVEQKKALRTRT